MIKKNVFGRLRASSDGGYGADNESCMKREANARCMVKAGRRSRTVILPRYVTLSETISRYVRERNLSDPVNSACPKSARDEIIRCLLAQVALYFCINYRFPVTFDEKGGARATALIFIH